MIINLKSIMNILMILFVISFHLVVFTAITNKDSFFEENISNLNIGGRNNSEIVVNHKISLEIDSIKTNNPVNVNNVDILSIHDQILIIGDSDFNKQADENSWSGNGTKENPYVIQDYSIQISSDASRNEIAINIQHTSLYFIIKNCIITADGSSISIKTNNVSNGIIRNNTITHSGYGIGIDIWNSKNLILEYNLIKNNQAGARIITSSNVSIVNNIAIQSWHSGIFLEGSNYIKIINNTSSVFTIWKSNNNLISKNRGSFSISDSSRNKIADNICSSINVTFSHSNIFVDNLISGSGAFYSIGMHLREGWNTTVINNTVLNTYYGFKFFEYTNSTIINNTASNNEIPYRFQFSEENIILNNKALTKNKEIFLVENHELSKPIIAFPVEGDTLSGSVVINWNNSNDLNEHRVYYSVYIICCDNEIKYYFEPIYNGIEITKYEWQTKGHPNGEYTILIEAFCIGGQVSIDTVRIKISNIVGENNYLTSGQVQDNHSNSEIKTTGINFSLLLLFYLFYSIWIRKLLRFIKGRKI